MHIYVSMYYCLVCFFKKILQYKTHLHTSTYTLWVPFLMPTRYAIATPQILVFRIVSYVNFLVYCGFSSSH